MAVFARIIHRVAFGDARDTPRRADKISLGCHRAVWPTNRRRPPPSGLYALRSALAAALAAETADADGDGVPNGEDSCPTVANAAQTDVDMNGIGDACEPVDSDGDEVSDGSDNCPYVYNPDQADADGDGRGDACEEAAPEALTGTASELKGSSAKVSGTVNPEGTATSYQFVYGTTTEYGYSAPATPKEVGSGSTAVAVAETLPARRGGSAARLAGRSRPRPPRPGAGDGPAAR
jgi:hypothetical protein